MDHNQLIETAASYYHGEEGYNCAQAILKTFQDNYNIPEEVITNAKTLGRGKAENGMCGALYAANIILNSPDKKQKAEHMFFREGGSTKCIEIRQAKTISCKDCVKLAAHTLLTFSR